VKWAQWDKTQSIALRWWECGLFREAQHLAECHGVAVHTLWVHQRRLVFCQASGVRDTGSRSADYLAEAYYRINVYYPAINSVSSDIQLQFGSPQLLFLWVCFYHVGLLISSVSSGNNWKTLMWSILHCCKLWWETLRRNTGTFCGDSSGHSLQARSVQTLL